MHKTMACQIKFCHRVLPVDVYCHYESESESISLPLELISSVWNTKYMVLFCDGRLTNTSVFMVILFCQLDVKD